MRCPHCGGRVDDAPPELPQRHARPRPGEARCQVGDCGVIVPAELVDRRGRCPRCARLARAAAARRRKRLYRLARRTAALREAGP